MSKEAMTLALELFEQFGRDSRLKYEHQAIYKTIVALKEALAKQEQGEPVAWMSEDECTVYTSKQVDGCFQHDHIPLYTTPQQRTWVGLDWSDLPEEWVGNLFFKQGARWAEAKLKEKNT